MRGVLRLIGHSELGTLGRPGIFTGIFTDTGALVRVESGLDFR